MVDFYCIHGKIFYKIFKGKCHSPSGGQSLFVDVGANFGWFSVLAAAMGCRQEGCVEQYGAMFGQCVGYYGATRASCTACIDRL